MIGIPISLVAGHIISNDYFLLYILIWWFFVDILVFPGQYTTERIPQNPTLARVISFFVCGTLVVLAFIFSW